MILQESKVLKMLLKSNRYVKLEALSPAILVLHMTSDFRPLHIFLFLSTLFWSTVNNKSRAFPEHFI